MTKAPTILENCINCAACEEACPPGAIRRGEEVYEIDSGGCTLCDGEYEAPRCVEVCPIDDCVVFAAAG